MDPVADRMTPDEREKWEALTQSGYSQLREAHELWMEASKREAK